MKPGFEKNFAEAFEKKKPSMDTDLDGEIYADQLHTLLQRITPELNNMIPADIFERNIKTPTESKVVIPRKLTDEEKIWNQIHGNVVEDTAPPKRVTISRKPHQQIPHHGGAFEGIVGGPKTFRQGYSFQIIRKPGCNETRRTVTDKDGNTKTIIRRTVDGKTETTTTYNGVDVNDKAIIETDLKANNGIGKMIEPQRKNGILDCGSNLYVTKDGFVLPKNLW